LSLRCSAPTIARRRNAAGDTMATIHINEHNFESATKEGIVLLDFWAE
jgi:hypothetical protein